jgi:hypothetical protein
MKKMLVAFAALIVSGTAASAQGTTTTCESASNFDPTPILS